MHKNTPASQSAAPPPPPVAPPGSCTSVPLPRTLPSASNTLILQYFYNSSSIVLQSSIVILLLNYCNTIVELPYLCRSRSRGRRVPNRHEAACIHAAAPPPAETAGRNNRQQLPRLRKINFATCGFLRTFTAGFGACKSINIPTERYARSCSCRREKSDK